MALQVVAGRGGEQGLGQPERDSGCGRQLADEALGRGVDILVVNGCVREPPLHGLRAGQLPAEHQQLSCPGWPDDARQEPGAAGVGRESAPHEGIPEDGIARCDGEVGRGGDLRADADRPAAHRAYHRQLQLEQQRDQPVGLRREPPLNAPGTRLHGRGIPGVAGADVEAAAEVGA
jgi:hypothetical protein